MQLYFEPSKDGSQNLPDQQKILSVVILDPGSLPVPVLLSLGFVESPDLSLVL